MPSFNLVTTAWAKGLDPLPLTPPPPQITIKSYRDVNLPSILNSFIIKEETKIELNILTILPVPPIPPPPTHPPTHTHKIIKILKKIKIQKEEIKTELNITFKS